MPRKVLLESTNEADFKLDVLGDSDMPASYAPGNWDTAFGWGDHAGLYGELSGTNVWEGINRFAPDGIEIYNSGISAEHTKLRSVAITSPKTITFPNATGTVALSGTAGSEVRTNTQLDGRYGPLAAENTWSATNTFNSSDLRLAQGGHEGSFVASLSGARLWTFPDKSGTVAMTSDLLTPGGTANQIQTNNGSGGLAGIPVTESDLALLDASNVWTGLQQHDRSASQLSRRPTGGANSYLALRVDEIGAGAEAGADGLNWGSNVTHIERTRTTDSAGAVNVRGVAWTRFGGNVELALDMDAGGAVFGSPVGGFQGTGVINAEGMQVDGNDAWHSGNLEYDTETVSLGGDFGTGAGSEVKCVRVGDQVTITLLGNLTHASSAAPDSAASPIPSKYRPLHTQINFFHEDLESLGRPKALIRITTAGKVEIRYSAATTNTPVATSITYNV